MGLASGMIKKRRMQRSVRGYKILFHFCAPFTTEKIEINKRKLPQEHSKIVKSKEKMARTKQVHQKKTPHVTRANNASMTVQSLPLPNGTKEEGELLYRQYFVLHGMSPELREHLKHVLNWTDKQITAHVKFMTKQWRR